MEAATHLDRQVSETEALRWVTLNAAWTLGIEDKVGSLETGKHADIVIWDKSPLSVYSKPTRVIIDGKVFYDRSQPQRLSDFEVGQPHIDHQMGASHD